MHTLHKVSHKTLYHNSGVILVSTLSRMLIPACVASVRKDGIWEVGQVQKNSPIQVRGQPLSHKDVRSLRTPWGGFHSLLLTKRQQIYLLAGIESETAHPERICPSGCGTRAERGDASLQEAPWLLNTIPRPLDIMRLKCTAEDMSLLEQRWEKKAALSTRALRAG